MKLIKLLSRMREEVERAVEVKEEVQVDLVLAATVGEALRQVKMTMTSTQKRRRSTMTGQGRREKGVSNFIIDEAGK